jgi:hypothetical protein
MKRKPCKLVVVVVALVHVGLAALTWRDLRDRSPEDVRGNKTAWKVASALNTGAALAYWLFGRRCRCGLPDGASPHPAPGGEGANHQGPAPT